MNEEKNQSPIYKVKNWKQSNFFDISKGSIKPGQPCLPEYILISMPFCVFYAWENVSMNITSVI